MTRSIICRTNEFVVDSHPREVLIGSSPVATSRRRVLRLAAGAAGALALPGIQTGAAAGRQRHPFPRLVDYPGQAIGPNHRTQSQQDED